MNLESDGYIPMTNKSTERLSDKNIKNHVGNKYLRTIHSPVDGRSIEVDVYAVLEAFKVTCPARQHTIKKLLCAGLRGKGSEMKDLEEAINSSGPRILEMQEIREIEEYIEHEYKQDR